MTDCASLTRYFCPRSKSHLKQHYGEGLGYTPTHTPPTILHIRKWRHYDEILWWQADFGLRPRQTFWHLDNINILNLLFWLFATDYSISISFIAGWEMLNTVSLKPSLCMANRHLVQRLWKGSASLFFLFTLSCIVYTI